MKQTMKPGLGSGLWEQHLQQEQGCCHSVIVGLQRCLQDPLASNFATLAEAPVELASAAFGFAQSLRECSELLTSDPEIGSKQVEELQAVVEFVVGVLPV